MLLKIEHYFEMTKDQARLGLQIYKTFAEQTTKSMEYFSVAKRMESVIHITIPQLKHVSAFQRHGPLAVGVVLYINR